MNRTTIFRVLGFVVGGVVLASAGLASGMALAPARRAAIVVEPLSTASPLTSADLPSQTTTLLPLAADNGPIAPSSATPPQPDGWPGGYGGWTGSMGNRGWDDWEMRPGMSPQYNAAPGYSMPGAMNGNWGMRGGMMNDGWGMGGYRGNNSYRDHSQTLPSTAQPITSLDAAAQAVRAYLVAFNNPDLSLAEVIRFGDGYYARVREQSTGRHAFALMVDPATGQVWPEPGPNVSWNSRYGQGAAREMTVTAEQARQIAQASLDLNVPGATAGDPLTFYGYYTFDVWQADQIIGMVSVSGLTGEVWYHKQYGPYIDQLILIP